MSAGAGRNLLAYDVGGTNLRSALVDPQGRLLARREAPTRTGLEPLLAALASEGRELLAASASLPGGAPAAIGLATAGYVDARAGSILECASLDLLDAPLGARLADELGLPVRLVNDVNAAAVSEARAAGASDLVALFVGTGVGTGFVCGGALVEGRRGMAAEGGHAVFREGGLACSSGHLGCYQSYLGGAALEARARDAGLPPDAQALFDLWRRGDPRAAPIVRDAFDAMASLCRLLVTLLDPELIVLAGGVAASTPELREAARAAVDPHPLSPRAGAVAVREARHGGDAGLLGAALVARELLAR